MSDSHSGSPLIRWRTVKLYPLACQSVGTKVGIFHGNHWWHTTGPARDAYNRKRLAIRVQLNDTFNDRCDTIVHFNLYMISRTANTAAAIPTIMFFCKEKEPRKAAKRTLDEGGILQHLPGFRTGHQSTEPGICFLVQPASQIRWKEQSKKFAPDVYFDPGRHIETIGMPIFVDHGEYMRQATANAVFEDERCVYISVSHVFAATSSAAQSPASNSDSDYDVGSGTEYESDGEQARNTSRASISSSEDSSDSCPDSASPDSELADPVSDAISITASVQNEQSLTSTRFITPGSTSLPSLSAPSVPAQAPPREKLEYLGYMSRSCDDIDCAVIQIINTEVYTIVHALKSDLQTKRQSACRDEPALASFVLTHTSSGAIPGSVLDTVSCMRLPNSPTFQEVRQVHLDRCLDWGDCGAVVSTGLAKDPYGFIVASSTDRLVAYIIPADLILESSGLKWSIQRVFDEGSPHENPDSSRSLDPVALAFNRVSLPDYPIHLKRALAVMLGKAIDSCLQHKTDKDLKLGPQLSPMPRLQAGNLDIPQSTVSTSSAPRKSKRRYRCSIGIASPTDPSVAGCPAPLFTPIDVSMQSVWEKSAVAPLRFIGKSLDPFQNMYQTFYPRVSVEALQYNSSRHFSTYGLEKHWIPCILEQSSTYLSFLHIEAAYGDVISERATESLEAMVMRQEVITMVGEDLLSSTRSVADHNITAVVQLIMAEIIARKETELVLHERGLEAMIRKRGALGDLGMVGHLSSLASWTHLESAILREAKPQAIYAGFCEANCHISLPMTATVAESPIYCPRGSFVTLQRSKKCSPMALKLVSDMFTLIRGNFIKQSPRTFCDPVVVNNLIEKITTEYLPVSQLEKTRMILEEDWKYEAIRVTSMVLATAISRQRPLSESLSFLALTYQASEVDSNSTFSRSESVFSSVEDGYRTPFSNYSASPAISTELVSFHIKTSGLSLDAESFAPSLPSPSPASTHSNHQSHSSSSSSGGNSFYSAPETTTFEDTVVLRDLKEALEKSNLSDCWSDMAGVLLWIGLTVGAASRRSSSKVLSRYFAAIAMRASIMLCFDHPEAVHATLLQMTEIVETLSIPIDSTVEGIVSKKRKM
ncbi:hypothetical protein IAQ61_008037 [Plenodomus lingam]|uniref:uncharacterized protein n=1 Tax=Leptosphaeria maculans TaxID=5022 RepID=UPI00332A3C82|nr:hypothetical protein IAQ61_008037 [Plenodomus lingam]